jgi:flavin-binding protein dodecin
MSEQVYKQIEITGSSKTGLQDAIENAITRAGKTIRHMRWFKVEETRGYIEGDKVAYWQVTIKVGFSLDDPEN